VRRGDISISIKKELFGLGLDSVMVATLDVLECFNFPLVIFRK
jgi:hypothetical protein